MSKTFYAICIDEKLAENPDHWVIARVCYSEPEASAVKSLDYQEQYRDLRINYHSEKGKEGTYAVDGKMLSGAVYKLTIKEVGQ